MLLLLTHVLVAVATFLHSSSSASMQVKLQKEKGDQDPVPIMIPTKDTEGNIKEDPELASLTPPQFLIVSSPMEKKISYVILNNFKAVGNKVHALIDAGLVTPQDIALDEHRELLFVADVDQRKILRYKLRVLKNRFSGKLSLVTDGVPMTVVENKTTSWLTVDVAGNLFFSEKPTNKIYKISRALITDLESGVFLAKNLRTESEVALISSNSRLSGKPTAAPPTKPVILTLYDKAIDPNVASPEGVATNGKNLFWVNGNSGAVAGTVVKGTIAASQPYTSEIWSNEAESARGLCLTDHLAFFSSQSTVFGLSLHGGVPVKITQDLQLPRGCAWDGDGTIYLSDGKQNALFSFPSGQAEVNKIPQKVVDLHDPFGVAVLTHFTVHIDKSGVRSQAPLRCAYPLEFGKPGASNTVPRWYYNIFTSKCEPAMFEYSEFNENVNSFETRGLCQEACVQMVRSSSYEMAAALTWVALIALHI